MRSRLTIATCPEASWISWSVIRVVKMSWSIKNRDRFSTGKTANFGGEPTFSAPLANSSDFICATTARTSRDSMPVPSTLASASGSIARAFLRQAGPETSTTPINTAVRSKVWLMGLLQESG